MKQEGWKGVEKVVRGNKEKGFKESADDTWVHVYSVMQGIK